MQERRDYVRVQVPVLIEFPHPQTWQTERSFTCDVSATGLRFPTSVKMDIGQEVALTVQLPFQQINFNATGEVVWVREIARLGTSHYEVGLQFRWIDEHDRQRLTRFFQNFLVSKV